VAIHGNSLKRVAPSAISASPVADITPLKSPWQTADPFLLCAYHEDLHPKGDDAMGPAASLADREPVHDFSDKDGWRMHSVSVQVCQFLPSRRRGCDGIPECHRN
jgi:hypothetical protein